MTFDKDEPVSIIAGEHAGLDGAVVDMRRASVRMLYSIALDRPKPDGRRVVTVFEDQLKSRKSIVGVHWGGVI